MQANPGVGFVGLGQMGQPMALNILKATGNEEEICVYDVREERIAPLIALGASQAFCPAGVARSGGIVFTMVPDDQALLQVALSEDGLLSHLGPGGIHLSLSTISPELACQLAKLYAHRGSSFLAATVLGRPDVAQRAELSLFLSGEAAAKQRVKPYLTALARKIHDLGDQIEAAPIVKIAANFLIAASVEAMGEAAALVEGYGFDRARFLRMLVESPLFRGNVFEGYGEMIGARDFSDAKFPVGLGLKDAELAKRAGQHSGVDLPYIDALLEHLMAARTVGRESEDWSVLTEFARAQPGRAPLTKEARFS
ncbi:MAG TPA: NAD(P)-dependent oxidoreductase [Ktedonobacteraceae bacterium]|nr:NAD(P)-dependent oxidoreductase [Ktedonobacteraceae bacterium]